jgi:hypothetical protein
MRKEEEEAGAGTDEAAVAEVRTAELLGAVRVNGWIGGCI